MNRVWESKLDNKYDVFVENTEGNGYKGFLVIKEGEKELLREQTSISFGARFGADFADIQMWEERACQFVDSL